MDRTQAVVVVANPARVERCEGTLTTAWHRICYCRLQTFTKNQLWHPLDHKKKQEFKLATAKGPKAPVMLMSKLDEVYRCGG